ncbi:hypothetical protein MMA231_04145 (plasmid) [Asticcacaulis sp. MM231]|uniref:glycosyltransferase family 2 protein n=1 Tax=Asticcacaulis sp. MM231 TaxID=3157666 RepID=UPI0032D59D6C
MKIAIAIATAGRRAGLSDTLGYLRQQTRMADSLYLCPAASTDLDLDALTDYPCPSKVVQGERGLPAQRNAILRALGDEDIVVFFDDDYLPEPGFLAELETLFARHPDLVIATGHVLADGAQGPGILYDDAVRLIQALPPLTTDRLETTFGGYGCNMAVRVCVMREARVEFDERLPLYAWWEDIDFSRRLAPFGQIKQSFRLRGVHLGSKTGRSPGKRLGYSQVANLLYMVKKGSIPRGVAYGQISKHLVANLVKSLRPEPWVDRPGRVAGNFLALTDALRGVVDPGKILKL